MNQMEKLNCDIICEPIQKMVFERLYGGAAVNSFEPRTQPGKRTREDGVVYVNDVPYGSKYPNSYFDIWYQDAAAGAERPTVVYFHGGGFIFGDKVTGDPMAKDAGTETEFCADIARHGYNVVSANYALSPEYRFPAQLDQVNDLFAFLGQNGGKYALDMTNVFIGGGSAGADLTQLYGCAAANPEYAEKLGFVPALKEECIAGLLIDEAALSLRNFEENMHALLGCWLGQDLPYAEKTLELLTPLAYIENHYLPSFINSSNEQIWFKDSADDLAAVLEKNGTEYELFYRGSELGKLEHGYMRNHETSPLAEECYEHMLRFMRRRMEQRQNMARDEIKG